MAAKTTVHAWHKAKQRISLLERAIRDLHSGAVTQNVVGRDAEIEKVTNFVERSFKEQAPAVLHIWGLPGTGKTCCVDLVVSRYLSQHPCARVIRANALSMCNYFDVLAEIFQQCGLDAFEISKLRQALVNDGLCKFFERIKSYTEIKSPFTLLVVDEADKLPLVPRKYLRGFPRIAGSLDVLVELVHCGAFSLSLIAVSNCATEEVNQNQRGRRLSCKREIETLALRPYTAQVLKSVVLSRLEGLVVRGETKTAGHRPATGETGEATSIPAVPDSLLDMDALELCARKVAAYDGDCRRVLDACRRILSKLLLEAREQLKMMETLSPPMSVPERRYGKQAVAGRPRACRTPRLAKISQRGQHSTEKFDDTGRSEESSYSNGGDTCKPSSACTSGSFRRTRSRYSKKANTVAVGEEESRRKLNLSDSKWTDQEDVHTDASTQVPASAYSTAVSGGDSEDDLVVRSHHTSLCSPDWSADPFQHKSNTPSTSSGCSPTVDESCVASKTYDGVKSLRSDRHAAASAGDVVKVLSAALSGSFTKAKDVLESLPTHQQLVMCAVCACIDHDRVSTEGVSQQDGDWANEKCLLLVSGLRIQREYLRMCELHSFGAPLTTQGLKEALSGLENSGLLRIARETKKASAAASRTPGVGRRIGKRAVSSNLCVTSLAADFNVQPLLNYGEIRSVLMNSRQIFKLTFRS